MLTRKLTPDDTIAIEDLVSSRWKLIKKRRDSTHDKELIHRLITYTVNSNDKIAIPGKGYVYGAFDQNNNLVSAITQKFWSEWRIHYISNMVVRPNISNLYDVTAIGLAACIDEAIHSAEEIEFFTWYWTTELRAWNHREEQWYKTCAAFRRYHVFLESILGAGVEPQFQVEKLFFGSSGPNTDSALKMAVLKPEFRHRYYQHRGLITEDFVPLQYLELEDKDLYINQVTWSKKGIKISETTLEFFESISNLLEEGKIIVRPDDYPDHIKFGDHRYFKTEIDGNLIGVSAMTRCHDATSNTYRIYHRAAYVMPNYRRQGIWRKMMKYKIKYMLENDWHLDSPVHTVSVAESDSRYKNDGWKLYKSGIQHYMKNNEILETKRQIWYCSHEDIIKIYS